LEKEAMTETVDVREAQLPELLTLASEGNEVIISEGDKVGGGLGSISQAAGVFV
jgi:hypothetical protein